MWVDDNQTYLATMLGEKDLHGRVPVRAASVVAKYTEEARSALSFLKDAHLECYVARCFSTASEEQFIALERPKEISAPAPLNSLRSKAKPQPVVLRPVELTDEEVDDFLGERAVADNKKSASSFI